MTIKTIEPGYVKVTEQSYTPSKAELYYYYSGTYGSLNPDNPYASKKTSVKKFQYVLSKKPKSEEVNK